MIKIGQVYRARDDPNRLAIIERVEELGMYTRFCDGYIFYRVPVIDGHDQCSLDESNFTLRYHLFEDVS